MRKMKGLTLIEVLLALGVAAIIIVGAIAFFSSAASAARVNQAQSEVQAFVASVNSLYVAQPNFAGLSGTVLDSAGKVPAGIRVSAGVVRNPFGGTYTFDPAAFNGAENAAFTVTMNNVPQSSCVEMLSSTSLSGAGLYGVAASGTVTAPTAPTGGDTPARPDIAAATTQCSHAQQNTIRFFAK